MTDEEKEINWEEEYKKECQNWREIARTLSDCILMRDAYEAHECKFDEELYEKGIELAEAFSTDQLKEQERLKDATK